MFLYYRGVNPNVAVNVNVKFVDISERRSKGVRENLKTSEIVEKFYGTYVLTGGPLKTRLKN